MLRYFPEDADQKTKGILSRYADLRYKAMAARQHGAKAMLVVTGPRSPNAGELAPMTFDTAIAGSGIVAASITGDVATAIFAAAPDKTLDAAQKSLDAGNPHVAGFALPGRHASACTPRSCARSARATTSSAICRRRRRRPASRSRGSRSARTTITSATATAATRSRDKDEAGKVHCGADDNASGTAAVLAIAETLAKQPRQRNVLLGFWSGEELGLLGSAAFATTAAGAARSASPPT